MQERLPLATGDRVGARYKVETVTASAHLVVATAVTDKGQRVALQVPRGSPERLGSAAIDRFSRHARALVGVKNDHLVRVLDAGALPAGLPFVAAELVQGSDLATVLRRDGVMKAYVGVDYVIQACDGLAAAHRAGVVHGRLRPGSLLLTHDRDGAPVVKVADLPFAALDPAPEYLAPEQLRGSSDVDARADVWALGAILFELVTGHAPFAAETPEATIASVLDKPTPVLEVYLPGAPPGLGDVLRRCLEKDRKKRYMTVGALAHALGELRVAPSISVASRWDDAPNPGDDLPTVPRARRSEASRRANAPTYVLPRRRYQRARDAALTFLGLTALSAGALFLLRRWLPVPAGPSGAASSVVVLDDVAPAPDAEPPLATASSAAPPPEPVPAPASASAAPSGSVKPHARPRRPKKPRPGT